MSRPPIQHDTESFADYLDLESIAVVDEQSAEVAYLPLDEEMFGGHFIVCTIHDDASVINVLLAD